MLLRVWRKLIATMGSSAPRLVVIGRRGWMNEEVFREMDSTALSDHLIECHDLPDASIARLLAGACALLMPSLAEGYGLPVAEALATGTPVIASDLESHRGVAGALVEYLPSTNDEAWHDAIVTYAAPASQRRAWASAQAANYKAPRWTEHFSMLDELLVNLLTSRQLMHAS